MVGMCLFQIVGELYIDHFTIMTFGGCALALRRAVGRPVARLRAVCARNTLRLTVFAGVSELQAGAALDEWAKVSHVYPLVIHSEAAGPHGEVPHLRVHYEDCIVECRVAVLLFEFELEVFWGSEELLDTFILVHDNLFQFTGWNVSWYAL